MHHVISACAIRTPGWAVPPCHTGCEAGPGTRPLLVPLTAALEHIAEQSGPPFLQQLLVIALPVSPPSLQHSALSNFLILAPNPHGRSEPTAPELSPEMTGYGFGQHASEVECDRLAPPSRWVPALRALSDPAPTLPHSWTALRWPVWSLHFFRPRWL